MKFPPSLILVLTLGLATGAGEPPLLPTVDVAGVAVVRESFDEGGENPYRPFGLEPGTRLSVVFRSPAVRLVCFDAGASTVDSFTDDRGTNLMALAHRLQVPGYLGHGCGIIKNGRVAHVEIFGGTPPAAGAGFVQARGKAVFFTGSTTARLVSAPVKAEKGAEIHVGEAFHFQVARWDEGGIGGKGATVSLRVQSHPAGIAQLRFLDGGGQVVESRPAGTVVEGEGEDRVFLLHFQLAAMPPEIALEIDSWSDLQRVEVPYEARAGIGGAPAATGATGAPTGPSD